MVMYQEATEGFLLESKDENLPGWKLLGRMGSHNKSAFANKINTLLPIRSHGRYKLCSDKTFRRYNCCVSGALDRLLLVS